MAGAAVAVLALVLSACSTAGSSGSSVLGTLADPVAANSDGPAAGAPAATPSAAVTVPSTTSPSPPPPPPAEVTANPGDGADGIDPLAPVTVAVAKGTIESVRLTNPDGVEIPGILAADKLSWTAQTELGYGKTYTLTTSARAASNSAVTETTSSFTTVVPDNKTKAYTYPSDGMTVGVAQPVSIHFDEPVPDRAAALRAITVTTTPAQVGGFRWIDDQEVRWRPAEFWQPGTTVAVTADIYGKNLGDGLYGQEDLAVTFTIGRSMTAEIDDNTHTMVVKENGAVIREIPVSLGSNKYPTYNGIHVVAEKYDWKLMDSSTWGLTGAGAYRTNVQWATRISSSGEFVHAAPWSVWAQGKRNVSHGCINVSTADAKWFQNFAHRGDVVEVVNSVKKPKLYDPGMSDWNIPWEVWKAGNTAT